MLDWGKFLAADSDEQLEQLAMNNPDIARAKEALDTLSQDPAGRELARQRRLAEMDYRSGLSEARTEGKAEGKAKGLREAIEHLCQIFGVELTAARSAALNAAPVQELHQLHEAVARTRAWPAD